MPTIVDLPAEGDVVDRFCFAVAGWVWLGADQDRIAAVEVWCGAVLLGESATLTHRPDVCAALALDPASRTGFEAAASHPAAARGSTIDFVIRVRFRDGGRTDPLCGRSVRSFGFDETPRTTDPARVEAVRAGPSSTDRWPRPPDPLQIRQVGGVWGELFYREGRVILAQIETAFEDAGKPLSRAASILDFGCGCGRVLSGFADKPPVGELWGCDIDAEAIAWNERNLRQVARFCVNPVLPPSAFSPGQFDAIYSVSVFTHLPEDLQFVWLNELRRILRPGGILVASTHGGHYYCAADHATRAEIATRGFAYRRGAPTAGLPDFYMLAYHSEAYIRSRWTRFFELLAVRERLIHGAHDAIVLRRRED